MANLKPIETRYNGYRFRSRLEARWAVFMDALGIEYQYEPEGFDLGDGYYYLPDFYLPETKAWIEVKGDTPTKIDVEKMIRFAETKCDFLRDREKFRLLKGNIPDHLLEWDSSYGVPCYNFVSINESRYPCYDIFVARGILYPAIWIPTQDEDAIWKALTKARQARFEHGECG